HRVLTCCRSLDVSIPKQLYEVARGGEITMSCSFIPALTDFKTLILTWEAFPDNPDNENYIIVVSESVATYIMNNPVDIAPDYEGRTTLEVNLNSKMSTLRLTKVTMQDNRRYQCSVIIPNDIDGTTAATTSLLVLVAPSVPSCRIEGTAEYWHNISLICMSEEGSPKPTYNWMTYSVENVHREFPPKTAINDGVVSLYNISKEMSGFYICTSTNRVGSASCNMTLAVMPGSINTGSIAGIAIGVIAGLLVLGIIIFCCCRKKGKKDKYAEGAPNDVQFYDKDAPETGENYLDDKLDNETVQHYQHEDKAAIPENYQKEGPPGHKMEDDQQSYNSSKDRNYGKGSDIDSHRDQDIKYDHKVRDHLDDQRYRHGGSREHLDDQRGRNGGSREHLDDQRGRYGGSREHLDGQRGRYGGSREHLDDQRGRYVGSREHLDDQRGRYGGSREHLEDQRGRYGGSREHLDDQRGRYGGSREHLDDQRGRYGGSRDRLDDEHNRY
uniref:Ig-like domain-containing protein n=1 Tax=Echeneis naucrates TaxID=173247 RepID=A0A665WSI0_ECHNA